MSLDKLRALVTTALEETDAAFEADAIEEQVAAVTAALEAWNAVQPFVPLPDEPDLTAVAFAASANR